MIVSLLVVPIRQGGIEKGGYAAYCSRELGQMDVTSKVSQVMCQLSQVELMSTLSCTIAYGR